MAESFAYVWDTWLIVAIGLIFGARNSPGWFCILSELRADIAAHYSGLKESPLHKLVSRITIPEGSSATAAVTFAPAAPDAMNPGTASSDDTPTHHSTFVDDNLMGEVQKRIRTSIQRSTESCYLMFGYPQHGILTSSLSEDKFVAAAAWRMEQLGLDVDTRAMCIIYPLAKRTDLLDCINEGWEVMSQHTQKEIATLLGLLRTVSIILPLGAYLVSASSNG